MLLLLLIWMVSVWLKKLLQLKTLVCLLKCYESVCLFKVSAVRSGSADKRDTQYPAFSPQKWERESLCHILSFLFAFWPCFVCISRMEYTTQHGISRMEYTTSISWCWFSLSLPLFGHTSQSTVQGWW